MGFIGSSPFKWKRDHSRNSVMCCAIECPQALSQVNRHHLVVENRWHRDVQVLAGVLRGQNLVGREEPDLLSPAFRRADAAEPAARRWESTRAPALSSSSDS